MGSQWEEEYGGSSEVQWTHETGDGMAHVLAHTAAALTELPVPKPPNG